jgi:FAD/FMN-containing dehydrogenase/Fe-S oxidoreductase
VRASGVAQLLCFTFLLYWKRGTVSKATRQQPSNRVRSTQAVSASNDATALARELQVRVRGEVRFDAGSQALYATDASNYRQVPIGVVVPKEVNDVIETIELCRRYTVPVLLRGGGTSLAGQCCNAAVVIDMSKYMNKVVELDPQRRLARVQPGTILDELRAAAERYHLTFGPDPATHNRCTLGGMIGNDSCGVHSVLAGKTVDNVEELTVLTYDGLHLRVGRTSDEELARIIAEGGRRGEIYAKLKDLRDRYANLIRQRFPHIPRRVSGYNLDQLLPENGFNVARALVGTEGTCVTVLEATVRLIDSPPWRSLLVLGYPDVYTACDYVPQIMAHGPIGLEGFDDHLVNAMKAKGMRLADIALLPEGGGWLLVEFGGQTEREASDRAHTVMEALRRESSPPTMRLFTDREETHRVWQVRESALGANAIVPGKGFFWPGWEDSAVPPEREGDYLRDLRKLMDQYSYEGSFYGHFGQGCIHTRINFDFTTAEGVNAFKSFIHDAAALVVSYGGSLSGEHGDGQARAELLPLMFGDELVRAFEEFKAIWDPNGKMNPGKIVKTYRIDQNLRLGTNYAPPQLKTHFAFPDDHGSFAAATLRCVGVGRCRRLEGGTMCPSYMVTREEMHSTRGRARLLFEMLQGDPLRNSWQSESVREALDLCLACKGCKSDCPVNVDIATYKSEFLSHYYAGRLRPVAAYSMGLIYWWARIAAHMPGVANFFTQTPPLSDVAKALAGIAPERQMPVFASQPFKQWFQQRGPRNQDKPRVLLWTDTFNNYFHPETAIAAVEVLETAGYQVEVLEQSLCCGRPLYDWGMLTLARHLLRQILNALRFHIRIGVPIVGLEPSCISVFRDELINLFPHDEDAKRLSRQSFIFSEFLERVNYQPPPLHRTAIVHGHCHHKSVLGMDAEAALLCKLGLDFEILDSGCCGMAGAFGFERGEKYMVSIKCGERVLLPAVRNAAKDTLIITDGFSCREQIAQTTDRHALHLAQVIQMAMHHGSSGPPGPYPEREYMIREVRAGRGR